MSTCGRAQPGFWGMILPGGSSLDDITIVQDHDKLYFIIKDGKFFIDPGD